MSSNGLAASRWANVEVAATAAAGPAAIAEAGLTSSEWVDPIVIGHDDNLNEWDSQSMSDSQDSLNSLNMSDIEMDEEAADPTVDLWRSWVQESLDLIHPEENPAFFENPSLLFSIVPLPAPVNKNIRTGIVGVWGYKHPLDDQLISDLTKYIESFSPAAIRILADQLETYLGRLLEDQEETGIPYDGKYGRECGLWMERLRMRDVQGELAN